jgi:3-hydroxyacyl-CoA dehydrogenase
MSVVSFTKQANIGVITVNSPPVNALSHAVRAGLRDAVTRAVADDDVAAIVLRCDGRTFIAGADIREFGKPMQEPDLPTVTKLIESSPKPIIAAIHGTALGGGFEVALACHFRIALPDAKVGLPEVKLGIIPGSGGTQRLPRLIGVKAALDMIVGGEHVPATKAHVYGAIDDIVEGDLNTATLAYAQRLLKERRPLRRARELPAKTESAGFFEEYRKSIAKKQRGFLAPFRAIDAMQEAAGLSFDAGMQRERQIFAELVASPQAKAQRHAFFAEREVTKIPGLPADVKPRDVKSVGVIGAGTMGGGIAMCFANAGIPVTLLEMNQANLDRGLNTVRKNYAATVSKGGLKQEELDKRMALIRPTLSYDDLGNVDLVIEAAFEDMGIKKEIFTKLDAICKPGAVLATNTSYLNINEIADTTRRPQDVVGMHFFSPANVMKLLENVRGAQSAPEVYATAMEVGKRIKKVPVLVGVCDGFVGNRMLAQRTRECGFMLEEGALPQQVDKVLYDFGFPMGPFAVGDLAGLDIGWRNRKSRLDRLTPREKANNILDKICELGRFGQKTGAGFYRYDEKRNPTPDPLIEALIVQHSQERGMVRRDIGDQEIRERAVYAMINEGAKILEEGIVARPLDIDIVWIYGYGFPVYRGGPMFYADQVGLKTIYEAILKYQKQVGEEYWKPAPLLERLAKAGKGFYSLS